MALDLTHLGRGTWRDERQTRHPQGRRPGPLDCFANEAGTAEIRAKYGIIGTRTYGFLEKGCQGSHILARGTHEQVTVNICLFRFGPCL